MTFEEWWDSKIEIGTPDTFRGWEESCRQAWEEGAKAEREACAKVCEERVGKWGDHLPDRLNRHLDAESNACANDIRARSNA